MSGYRFNLIFRRTIVYLFLCILLIISILPIWLLLMNATRSSAQIQLGVSLIPGGSLVSNFTTLIGRGLPLGQGFLNSLIISVSVTVLSVYFGIMTAYGLKVYNFKGKKVLYLIVMLMVMVPTQLSLTGLYQLSSRLGLLNSYVPLIIPAIASAGTVFFAKQYLDASMVPELIQAARIDGGGEFYIFNKIILPIAAPGAFTMGIFAFVGSWNNFFLPFVLISKKELFTLPMLLSTLKSDSYKTNYGMVYLGMAVTVVPIIVVYLCFSRYIVSGIAMGSVKE